MSIERFHRQILAFGDSGQRQIANTQAAIVGIGGLGSQVAQALAYLGVNRLTLIDDDTVETSNLNRLIGAGTEDVGREKTQVVARELRRANPAIQCQSLSVNLRSRIALEALMNASTVFGCVDNDGARLLMTELCAAYKKTYTDSATEVIGAGASEPFDFGGRVVVSVPGEFCLLCAGELDVETAKRDLETASVQQTRIAHGYGVPQADAPAVVSLNGIIANIAVTEFMVSATGIRKPNHKSTYRGMRGVVVVSMDTKRLDCINCGYIFGQGDAAGLMRYAVDG